MFIFYFDCLKPDLAHFVHFFRHRPEQAGSRSRSRDAERDERRFREESRGR